MSHSYDETEEFSMVLQRLVNMWGRTKGHIRDLEETNHRNQQIISEMRQQIADLKNDVRKLEENVVSLKKRNTELDNDNAKLVNQLATSRRDPSTVFTPDVSIQPIELEREYRDFVEQKIPNFVRILQKHFKETIPNFDKTVVNSKKNGIQGIISHYILQEEYVSRGPQEIFSHIIAGLKEALNLSELSFLAKSTEGRGNLTKDLEDLILKGQRIAQEILHSGGKLQFYQRGYPFSEEYHDPISGPETDAVIQYTITPAYVVKSVRLVGQPYLKPLQAARVVTTHATNSSDQLETDKEQNTITLPAGKGISQIEMSTSTNQPSVDSYPTDVTALPKNLDTSEPRISPEPHEGQSFG